MSQKSLLNKISESHRSITKFILCIIFSFVIVAFLHAQTTLAKEVVIMAGIFTLAAGLWVTEALPLFATSILVVGLQIILLANPMKVGFLGFEGVDDPSYKIIISAAADSILVLFFGGFILAKAASKKNVDKKIAQIMLGFFGEKPKYILLGFMIVTAFFSMWMSNTATTAMMIALVIPLAAKIKKWNPFKKALILGIPFAANIGGMGTPIGSPPNAVAVSLLSKNGVTLGFLQWMAIALPFVLVLLSFAWLLLLFMFPTKEKTLNLKIRQAHISLGGWFVVAVFAVTVFLWLTGSFTKLPSAVVALIPAIAFTSTGLLDKNDVNSIEWNILLLIGGGISLGAGMNMTGLDKELVALLPQSGGLVFAGFIALTIIMSTFMSNTATANLILPIGVSFAVGLGPMIGLSPAAVAMAIALAASSAMALPISTPPNAIAYSAGSIKTKDMIKAGISIGAVAFILFYFFAQTIMNTVGLT